MSKSYKIKKYYTHMLFIQIVAGMKTHNLHNNATGAYGKNHASSLRPKFDP